MDSHELAGVVARVRALVEEHYLDGQVATAASQALAISLAEGRYPASAEELADAVTADLQAINGDKHLRLVYHAEVLAERVVGDDAVEYAAMAEWADRTCSGIARIELLQGNVGYLDLKPVLFPVAQCGDIVAAAMTVLDSTAALIIDVTGCIGGDPAMQAFVCSYLYGPESVELTGLLERGRLTQSWTLPYVPGRRFGSTKPVYVLTSGKTFSGGEHLAYDLQQLRRATIVGERTGGGAHAREGFPVHPHLEATIPVARGVNPVTGTNWEGTGVEPDILVPFDQALDHSLKLAQAHLESPQVQP